MVRFWCSELLSLWQTVHHLKVNHPVFGRDIHILQFNYRTWFCLLKYWYESLLAKYKDYFSPGETAAVRVDLSLLRSKDSVWENDLLIIRVSQNKGASFFRASSPNNYCLLVFLIHHGVLQNIAQLHSITFKENTIWMSMRLGIRETQPEPITIIAKAFWLPAKPWLWNPGLFWYNLFTLDMLPRIDHLFTLYFLGAS